MGVEIVDHAHFCRRDRAIIHEGPGSQPLSCGEGGALAVRIVCIVAMKEAIQNNAIYVYIYIYTCIAKSSAHLRGGTAISKVVRLVLSQYSTLIVQTVCTRLSSFLPPRREPGYRLGQLAPG